MGGTPKEANLLGGSFLTVCAAILCTYIHFGKVLRRGSNPGAWNVKLGPLTG